ncbi:MAG: hypothetical protein OEY36_10200 [Gammaproteobacteria bacterium]|nr:hypothetical protein [Gammaproteobacteria bacterium]
MKKILLFVLVTLSVTVQADPFNIYLPFNTQYAPGVMDQMEMALVLGVGNTRKNFQLQVAPQTDDEKYIVLETETDEFLDVSFGFSVGLGYGFEFELNAGGSGVTSLKYDFDNAHSNWKNSVVIGGLRSISRGHGGAFIPQPEQSCSFFDIFCFMDLSEVLGFLCFSCSEPGSYEYVYQADIKGSTFAYMQGYQYSALVMPYWGVYYVGYDIDLKVTDNTGADNHQFKEVATDLMALVLGTKWRLGKKDNNFNKSMILNYLAYKDSSLHDGEFNTEIKMSFSMMF